MRDAIITASSVFAFMSGLVSAAFANPDGAPWGTANPGADENCHSCHFDGDAVLNSNDLSLSGLPDQITAGGTYILKVSLVDCDAVAAGFQMIASGGQFWSGEDAIEAEANQIRSAKLRRLEDRAEISWAVFWRAPETLSETIDFQIAVNASNDDASPFGDTIHFKSVIHQTAAK